MVSKLLFIVRTMFERQFVSINILSKLLVYILKINLHKFYFNFMHFK